MSTTTNTQNAITNAAQNAQTPQAPAQRTAASMMSSIVNSTSTKKLLENTLKENAGTFAASIIDLYNTDKYLQKCDPKQVFGECLKAASLDLPINKQLGFAYIVPYKDVPQFQIGYKGMIQLVMRTGAYKYINAGPVYEGEYLGEDKMTGEIDLGGARTSDTVIGYFAYIETNNGFSKALYWTKEKVISHAKRFSKSYNAGSAIWKEHFDEMAQKTVLRNLLSKWGFMTVKMASALNSDSDERTDASEQTPEPVAVEYEVDVDTGEVE